jgi:AbrB family looped-hinge helix DNA binding protein
METVLITEGFQVRIPKRAREALGLVPGQRLRIVQYAQRLELVPIRPKIDGSALFGDTRDIAESS